MSVSSNELKVWESHSGRCVKTEEYAGYCCAFSGDGFRLITCGKKVAVLWDFSDVRVALFSLLGQVSDTLQNLSSLHGQHIVIPKQGYCII